MSVAALLGLACGGSLAWAPAPHRGPAAVVVPQATAVGLSGGAELAVASSVRRLLPQMVEAMAVHRVGDRWGAELERGADPSDAPILVAYRSDPAPRFTTSSGGSAAADALLRWLDDTRHHGLEHRFASTRADLAARLAAFETGTELTRPAPVASDIAAHELAAAWLAAAGAGDDRLRATGDSLRDANPDLEEAATSRAGALTGRIAEQATLELGFARAAVALSHALAPRPRTEAVLHGRKGRYLSPDVLWQAAIGPVPAELVAAVLAAARAGAQELTAHLQTRLPTVGDYAALGAASRRYEALCEAGGWAPVRVPKHIRGRRWKKASRIEAVQVRLATEGWLDRDPTGVYDDPTVEAVKRFQRAHHVKATGSFEEHTAREMNVPCAERLAAIRLNIRRWRHTARQDEPTYVHVNLSATEVVYVRDGEEKARNRTVVGSGRWFWSRKEKRRLYPKKSPLLTDTISKVVVNPSWKIPYSIVRGEILPRIEKDPDYLAKKGYIVRTGSTGRQQYVEPPSATNTLGQVKLLFPNSESIYLHDTNQRGFFNNSRRDLSHGCIRVHDALDFAAEILVDDFAHVGERFRQGTIHKQSRNNSTYVYGLEQDVPVFLEYYSVSPDPDGSGMMRFHIDIYDYDLEVFEGAPLDRRVRRKRRNG